MWCSRRETSSSNSSHRARFRCAPADSSILPKSRPADSFARREAISSSRLSYRSSLLLPRRASAFKVSSSGFFPAIPLGRLTQKPRNQTGSFHLQHAVLGPERIGDVPFGLLMIVPATVHEEPVLVFSRRQLKRCLPGPRTARRESNPFLPPTGEVSGHNYLFCSFGGHCQANAPIDGLLSRNGSQPVGSFLILFRIRKRK